MGYKNKQIWQFGDFQTPIELALDSTKIIKGLGYYPKSIVEPSCGLGGFLKAAIELFPEAEMFVGVDVNPVYTEKLKRDLPLKYPGIHAEIINANFFDFDWSHLFENLTPPILVIGNPPWVTSSELSILKSKNMPKKSNIKSQRGMDALTGKSNFDISEWMLLNHLKVLKKYGGLMAMLCKTSVARKVMTHAWKNDLWLSRARLYRFDAVEYFNASVDACFFVFECLKSNGINVCEVYDHFEQSLPTQRFGYSKNGFMISDIPNYKKRENLFGKNKVYIWRSGIKHDCSKVMELRKIPGGYQNLLDELVNLEEDYLYPLIKSSDLAKYKDSKLISRYMLVTQKKIGEETSHLQKDAPLVWEYLRKHEDTLNNRKSSIYKNRPKYSIFGVGEYAFSPWKIAISGFYKKLHFVLIGPSSGKPVVFDDTVYFLPVYSEDEGKFLREILNSTPALEFLSSMIFWTDKRPITIDLLKRLDILRLSQVLGLENEYFKFVEKRIYRVEKEAQKQLFGLNN